MVVVKPHFLEKLQNSVAQCQKKTDYELECKIKYCTNSETISHELEKKHKKYSDLPKIYFDRAMKFLLSQNNLQHHFQDESLDISTPEHRITISDLDGIVDYINLNKWDESHLKLVTVIEKKKNINRCEFPGLNLIFDLKQESVIDDTSDICHKIESQPKDYRLKKRWTFIDSNWKYDLTMVKSSTQPHISFKTSDCLKSQNSFEIEVEFIGKTANVNVISREYLKSCLQLYAVVYGEVSLITSEEKFKIAREFYKIKREMFRINSSICSIKIDMTNVDSYQPNISDLINIMVGPKPVTLEKIHLREPGLGITSILKDYTVTPKADGERCLMWINSEGKVYLIDSSSTIKWTGITTNRHAFTLVDGELVTEKKMLGEEDAIERINLYAIFDIYIYNSQYVANCPLISKNLENSREKYIDDFVKTNLNNFLNKGLTLHKKEFYHGTDFLNSCSKVLNLAENYPYNIDGLIFTPKYFGVNCYFAGDVSNLKQNTWNLLFKWKPHQENTIDFLIKFDSQNCLIDQNSDGKARKFQLINLYVADRNSEKIHVTKWMKLTANPNFSAVKKQIKNQLNADTVPKLFIPNADRKTSQARLAINEKSKVVIQNGQEIVNDTIVEFYWNQSGDEWLPLRNREIKTQIYQANKQRNVRSYISNTANYWDVAVSIWNSIENPVTEGMIRGDESLDVQDDNSEIYYSQKMPREKRASVRITDFHNWIKSELIKMIPDSKSLMDIACGKGGDFYKWNRANLTKVFGIDIVRDNIENVSDGAYTRTAKAITGMDIQLKARDYSDCSWIYLTLDASKKIDNQYIDSIQDENDRTAARILYKISRPSEPDIRAKYWGYASSTFDIVSCQFAIHYFFKSSETLDNFIYNVDRHLSNGGYFIGTCLDGKLVKKRLANVAFKVWIDGKDHERTMWAIQKLYHDNTTSFDFGEQISVYMESINRESIEYLVNLDVLEDRLKSYNILRLEKQELEELNLSSYGSIRNFRDYYKDYHQKHSLKAEDTNYSYLNTTFVFKKI